MILTKAITTQEYSTGKRTQGTLVKVKSSHTWDKTYKDLFIMLKIRNSSNLGEQN